MQKRKKLSLENTRLKAKILYNSFMEESPLQIMPQQEFRPELLSRRGEAIAWGCGLLVCAVWIFLKSTGNPVHRAVPFLAIFLIVSAAMISLGNWTDRSSMIHIAPEGIHFENGLRNVSMQWEEIQKVEVFPSNWGKKVRVLGSKSHFDFRTLAEVKVSGETKGSMGFADGERILRYILEKSGVKLIRQEGNSYYYVRG